MAFGKLFETMRRQGRRWNHKRVYRVYCLLELNKRRQGKRRLPSRYPEPLLDLYLFRSLREVRQMTEDWMVRYNNERPHDSLNGMTRMEYLQAHNYPG
ncbi:MAG: transposase [Proteobacteria bacterium]|nr:transposase [Pseudomonadota bacterium]